MKKPKLQITDTHHAAAFERDKRTHNERAWGMLKHLQTRPSPGERAKTTPAQPRRQHRPFLIPPARRREGRKFSAGPGPAPAEPPGLSPASNPGATGRAERLGHPEGPSGSEGGGRQELRRRRRRRPPGTPRWRGQRGLASLSPRGAPQVLRAG